MEDIGGQKRGKKKIIYVYSYIRLYYINLTLWAPVSSFEYCDYFWIITRMGEGEFREDLEEIDKIRLK